MVLSSSPLFLYPLPAGTLLSLFAHVASSPLSKQVLWIQVLLAQYPAGRVGGGGCSLWPVLKADHCWSCSWTSTPVLAWLFQSCMGLPVLHLNVKPYSFTMQNPFHPHLYLAPATWYKHHLPSDSLSAILNFLTDSMTAGLHAWCL